MEFRLLGPLEVVDGGRALDLGGPKQRALLALLLLDANRPVSRDRLIDALWEDQPTPTAAKALQVYVSQLRKTLGRDRVVTAPGGYLLRTEPGEVDLARFQSLHGEGRPHDALALWRGEPLTEFARSQFARAEIARLEELHLSCLESRLAADLAVGVDVAAELEALVRAHPLRERLRELLILSLYRAGRQADALAAYQDARAALVEELGIEPGRALRDLQQSILRQDPVLDLAPAAPVRSAFVGRGQELARLVAGLDDAIAGRGRLFLLVGEAGIGKSRLAEELMQAARARRVDVAVGRCWEAGGAPAYWPWVQSLRELGGAALFESERDANDEGARFRLFDATVRFLASRRQPLVLFLDDMHAADEPSVLLLEFVARELASMRVLVVVASREAGSLAEVTREPVTTRLSLGGLGEQAVGDYVEAELDSRELAAQLYERTDGNPLFLVETVRLLAAEGRIAIPPSLREVIARRLARLGDECSRVLMLAAVLGREFDHDALATMAGLAEEELLDALDEAMAARVVTDVPGARDRSRFAHVLIRDALYESLTAARRVQLHRAALAVLEDDAEIAFHATAGSDYETARTAARRAGDRALSLLAYEEAARLYDVALAAKPDDETRCELLLARGEAELRGGDTRRAKATFIAAASLSRELGLSRSLARAAAGYGGRIVWSRAGDDPRLVPLLEEGLALLRGEDAELEVRLLARLSGALRDDFSRERRDALSNRAVEIARATGNAAALAYALVGRAHAINAPDTIDEFHALATELCEVAASVGDLERVEAGHILRVLAESWIGDRPAAEADLAAATELAQALKQPVHLWEAAGIRAMFALADGRLGEASALMDEALALGEKAIPEAAIPHYRMHRYCLAELTGGLEEVEPWIAALAAAQAARPVFACAHAHLLATVGREVEARGVVGGLLEALPFDQEWLYGMALLAEAAVMLDERELCAASYEALLPYEALQAIDQSEGCRGSVARYLGLLAAALGRPDEAAAHLRRAIAANERMGFAPWVERARQDLERISGAAPA
jgi:DNA-binding SARP family transcriptional activator